MKIIVGLGNPASRYEGTRHNMGFEVIDRLADRLSVMVIKKEKNALTGTGICAGQKVMLVKPQTFMNLSGESVRPLMDYYNVALEDVIVIVDDVSLAPGVIRLRPSGSEGGHNGLKSISQHLGSRDYARLRVGVGSANPGEMIDYVLGRPSADDRVQINCAQEAAVEAVLCWVTDGVDAAMSKYNGFHGKEEE